jgi:hypothetical protein
MGFQNLRRRWNRPESTGVDPMSDEGVKPNCTLSSPTIPHPYSRFHPLPILRGLFLQARIGAVDFDFASMRTLLQALVVAAMLLLDATSADASDCMCDRLSAEGCTEAAQLREAPATPPLWCERTDDPRCMPASTHGSSVNSLVPVAMSWARPIGWTAPPRTGSRMDIRVEGDARSEHSRRVERPPR